MKKLFLSFIMLCAFISLSAQNDCMVFFPNNPGAMLINKTYDAKGNLLGTMTYKIDRSYGYEPGDDIQLGFVMTDSKGVTVDQGNMDAYCEDGSFFMKMTNRTISPDVINALSTNTELIGDFLDYPDTSNDEYPFDNVFKMSGGEFTIQSKADKKEFIRVRVYNRQYEGEEDIITPAKKFHASKISFDFEVIKDKNTVRYKGIEWYAMNAGIVRSETRDSNNNLINYTELTTLKDK